MQLVMIEPVVLLVPVEPLAKVVVIGSEDGSRLLVIGFEVFEEPEVTVSTVGTCIAVLAVSVGEAESVMKALVVTASFGFEECSLVTANIVVAAFCVEFNIAMVTVTGAVVDAESVVMCLLSESMASLEDSMI